MAQSEESDRAAPMDADSAGVYLDVSPEDLNYGHLRRPSAKRPSLTRSPIATFWRRLKRVFRRKRIIRHPPRDPR
jgi:hypothetical protein